MPSFLLPCSQNYHLNKSVCIVNGGTRRERMRVEQNKLFLNASSYIFLMLKNTVDRETWAPGIQSWMGSNFSGCITQLPYNFFIPSTNTLQNEKNRENRSFQTCEKSEWMKSQCQRGKITGRLKFWSLYSSQDRDLIFEKSELHT